MNLGGILLSLAILGSTACEKIDQDSPEAALGDVIYGASENIPGYLAHRLSGDARRRFDYPSRELWLRNLIRSHQFVPVKGARINGVVMSENGKPVRTRYLYRVLGKKNGRVHELGTALVNCEGEKKKKDRYSQCYPVEFRPKACDRKWATAETMARDIVSAVMRDDENAFRTLTEGASNRSTADAMRAIREKIEYGPVVVDENEPLMANFGGFFPKINVYEQVNGPADYQKKLTFQFNCSHKSESLCDSGCSFVSIMESSSRY